MTVTRVLRAVGSVALWVAAALGVLTCAIWVATAAGWIKPLIVTSGSMEPTIGTGALLIATPIAVDDVVVGDVLTLESDLTGGYVTHRVESVEPVGSHGDARSIIMRGDANGASDPLPYVVEGDVWKPQSTFEGVGEAVARLGRPQVIIPALIALAALLGLSLLRDERPEPEDDAVREDSPAAQSTTGGGVS
ncbi:signal peptidase I [Demequina sp.]|uniref:signal peptidase I n=1 Tax=Demequina sp. TaxID=2050685 RepID=UPI003A86B346